ncbi:amidohydrolase/deacetylase family metallohydrolase [Candidatus Poribacteria bacterium]|nr:MAG: amidohydrolase/deacetylase family metallohydrolase [Candidatus Poribacteria bacterium]
MSIANRQPTTKYDLLLKGGTVIDAAQDLNAARDVAIADGVIAAVESDIPERAAIQTISVKDRYVTPGLIDIHTHVYYGVTTWGIRADAVCPTAGTTTVVDAGSPSWVTFPGFREFIAEPAQTNILTYIHISGIGLVYGPIGEMIDIAYAAPERVADTLQQHRDITVGVKVRQGKMQVGDNGVEPLKLAVEAAERAETSVMCHIGAGVPLPNILRHLRPGDVITHCFQGNGDNIIDEKGRIIPEVWKAREDGIIFDVGHGAGSFHYEVAQRAMEQGFISDVISTDLHTGNINGPVYDLPTTLSKLIHLGLPLADVIEKATFSAAKAIQREGQLGNLKVGTVADVAVFDVIEGQFEYFDSHGTKFIGNKKLKTELTIRAGKI